MHEINHASRQRQLPQDLVNSDTEALQPGNNPNIVPASPAPVFTAMAGSSFAREAPSPTSLTDRKSAPTSYPEDKDSDYFLHLLNPDFSLEHALPRELEQTEQQLLDLSLKQARKDKDRKAATDQEARDTFLQKEDLKSEVRKRRLDLCTRLGAGVLISSGKNIEAEKYALRAYYDLTAITPTEIKLLIHTMLFIIYDREGETTLTTNFLNKSPSSPVKSWTTGMIALGMEDRYRSDCSPLDGYLQLKKEWESKIWPKPEDQTFHLASNTDTGVKLKHLWTIFSPSLLRVRDIRTALTNCSRLIASIRTGSEQPKSTFSNVEELVAISPESTDYKLLKAVLTIFAREGGEAFWQSLSKYLGPVPVRVLTRGQLKVWVSTVFNLAIKESGIKGVSATELLPTDPQNHCPYVFNVLKPFFQHRFPFAIEYYRWLEFLEQSEQGENFVKDNEKLLNRGLSELPDNFKDRPAAYKRPLPDWIRRSTAPADWSINSIRYLFAIDFDRNPKRARQYAETFKTIRPEKGAILAALVHLEAQEYQEAFDVLDLPESNHPGTFLFRADILRKYPNDILRKYPSKVEITKQKLDLNECIVSDYVKAGERGLAKGYIQAAEFLMEKKPNQLNTWKKAADYYRLAANNCTETVDQQRNLIMAEFCQAEADQIKPASLVKDSPLHQDTFTADTVETSAPNVPVTERLELSVRPREKVKTVKHDRSALPHSNQAKVQFWPQMKQICTFMDNNNLSSAKAALDKLEIPKDTEAWIQAMVAQNKAWCIKLMLEEGKFSVPAKRDVGKKRGRNRGGQSKPPPAPPTRSKLVDEGQQHLQTGFKALGVDLPSLEKVLDLKIEPSIIACDQKKRQYASLLSTLAHFYSLAGEVSKSSKLRELYRKLYSQSHEIRDLISV